MSQSGHNTPGSEDPDAMVAQLLEQFQSSTSRTTPIFTFQGPSNAPQPVQPITGNSEEPQMSFEIVVPTVDNLEKYEYLPGHFEVSCVLGVDMHEPKLIVRLKSGERQDVSECD